MSFQISMLSSYTLQEYLTTVKFKEIHVVLLTAKTISMTCSFIKYKRIRCHGISVRMFMNIHYVDISVYMKPL